MDGIFLKFLSIFFFNNIKQSVIETDKKELLNDELYGFSDEVTKNVFVNIKNLTDMEQLFEELKELNSKYKNSKEVFDSFQERWKDKKKEIEEDVDQINKLKIDSIKILELFEKKFIDFQTMKKILKKEIPSTIILGELQSIFNYEGEKVEVMDIPASEHLLSKIKNAAEMAKKEVSYKLNNLLEIYGEIFDIYPTVKEF